MNFCKPAVAAVVALLAGGLVWWLLRVNESPSPISPRSEKPGFEAKNTGDAPVVATLPDAHGRRDLLKEAHPVMTATQVVHDFPSQEPKERETALTERDEMTLRTWYKRDDSTIGASNVGSICVVHNLSRSEIVNLIGPPSHLSRSNLVVYGYAPGNLLELAFDQHGIISEARLTGRSIARRDSEQ